MKTTPARLTAGAAAVFLVAACGDTSGQPAPVATVAYPADQACLRDIASTTGNPDVRVVRSTVGEAATEVIVGVGPTGQWRCIAYGDGTTAGIQSITDEGLL